MASPDRLSHSPLTDQTLVAAIESARSDEPPPWALARLEHRLKQLDAQTNERAMPRWLRWLLALTVLLVAALAVSCWQRA